MSYSPLVSIVIPCYNHAQFVQETIQSVIDQDYENIELIIIDDGSKDNSVEVIQEMIPACEERFKRFEFRHRPNKGLCATLNEALEWCEGEFFAPLASDDLILKYKTTLQVKYLLNNINCVGVFGGAKILKENGDISVERPSVAKKYQFKDIILNKFPIFTGSQLLRIKAVREVGGYSPEVLLEDFYINLKITKGGATLDTVPGFLVCYRRHENNTTNDFELINSERLKIIESHSDNFYYKPAIVEHYYNESLSLVPFKKTKSLFVFLKTLLLKPNIIFRLRTLKFFVKVFIPKAVLQNKIVGR